MRSGRTGSDPMGAFDIPGVEGKHGYAARESVVLKKRVLLPLATILLAPVLFVLLKTPTHQGPWKPEYRLMASSIQKQDIVTIDNFRRARYGPDGTPREVQWERRSVDLSELESVWYGISIFREPALAHTFLSFDFGDGDPVVVSVEARQRPDQAYGPVKGLLNAFHLIYVMADERDVIVVRTHLRGERVLFQPLTIDPATRQELFQELLARANSLQREPEFYNTLTSNCTNSLLRDVEFPVWRRYLDPRVLMAGLSDRVAYEFDVIDTRYALARLREVARLDPETFSIDDPAMSLQIRNVYFARLEQSVKHR